MLTRSLDSKFVKVAASFYSDREQFVRSPTSIRLSGTK